MEKKNRTHLFSVKMSDLVVETFRAGKNGGQRGDKVETAVRLRHLPSGAVAESREERSQRKNKEIALKRLAETPKFKWWVNAVVFGYDKAIRDKVDRWMKEAEVEYYDPSRTD